MADNNTGKKVAKWLKAIASGLAVFSTALPDATPYSPRSICLATSLTLIAVATHIETD